MRREAQGLFFSAKCPVGDLPSPGPVPAPAAGPQVFEGVGEQGSPTGPRPGKLF